MVLLAKVVVEFEIAVVAVADGGVGPEEIARGVGSGGSIARDAARPQRIDEIRRNRALRHTVGGFEGTCIRDVGSGRFRRQSRNANNVTLLLERQEIESLVLDDRSADRKTEIVVAQFRLMGSGRRKRRSGSIGFVAVEVVDRAMELVCT